MGANSLIVALAVAVGFSQSFLRGAAFDSSVYQARMILPMQSTETSSFVLSFWNAEQFGIG
jgi:hypothetical protein